MPPEQAITSETIPTPPNMSAPTLSVATPTNGQTDTQGSLPTASVSATTASKPDLTPDEHEKKLELHAHLANQLRIKKLELGDFQHRIGKIERELEHMSEQLHHIDQDIRRVEGEYHHIETVAEKQERESKLSQGGMRDKDMELKKRTTGTQKLEQEILRLKSEISAKELRKAAIKEETRKHMRQKEDLFHKSEVGLHDVGMKSNQVHTKQLQIARSKQLLAVKQQEISRKRMSAHHKPGEVDREIPRLEAEARRIEEDMRRVENEVRQLETLAHKEEVDAKGAQSAIRTEENALRKESDETVALEREIDKLKIEITAKEREINELKVETKDVMQSKEELRRKYELEHFSANTQFTTAHEKELQIERFKNEFSRKEDEITKKKQEEKEIKHSLMFLEQDIATLEAELRRMGNVANL